MAAHERVEFWAGGRTQGQGRGAGTPRASVEVGVRGGIAVRVPCGQRVYWFPGPVCSAHSLFGTPSLEGMLCLSFHLRPIGQHLVMWSQLAARKFGSGFFPDSGHLLSRKFNYHERRGKGDTS